MKTSKNYLYTKVIFDLDGTLCDTKNGILDCFWYTFNQIGIKKPEASVIFRLIGPPLESIFSTLLKTDDTKIINKCVRIFRAEYAKIGVIKTFLYPGVKCLLDSLKDKNRVLAVVTNKPLNLTKKILNLKQLKTYFTFVKSSNRIFKNHPHKKSAALKYILTRLETYPGLSILIGDSPDDIIAAKNNYTKAIGVTWGYGTQPELIKSGADYICSDTESVEKIILQTTYA